MQSQAQPGNTGSQRPCIPPYCIIPRSAFCEGLFVRMVHWRAAGKRKTPARLAEVFLLFIELILLYAATALPERRTSQVLLPTIPSTSSAFCAWKRFTAASVSVPK